MCNRQKAYDGVVSRSTADELPGELELPLAFVNTLDVEEARDGLGSRAALQAWLAERELVAAGTPVSRRDLALAIELRDALRRAFLAHSGLPLPSEDLEAVNRVLTRLPVDIQIDASGAPRFEPRGEGAAAALGLIVCDVARARTLGTWDRLKLCPAEDCLWAFFDSSKNRSRRWCSMNVCGNRTKTREYRRRRAASTGTGTGEATG
jgi:predicted RNA-binding Zn ribbon-like protein